MRKVGPKDKRRRVGRCLTCRESHLKCNRSRPCSGCQLKGLNCVYKSALNANENLTIINTPASSYARFALAKQHFRSPLETQFRMYFEYFFDFIGNNRRPSCLKALSRSGMGSHLQDQTIGNAILAAGALLCWQRSDHGKQTHRDALDEFYQKSCAEVNTAMVQSNHPVGHAVVYSSLIIAIYHFLTDSTSLRLINWFTETVRPLFRRYIATRNEQSFDKDLIALFISLDLIFAGCFLIDTPLAGDLAFLQPVSPEDMSDHAILQSHLTSGTSTQELQDHLIVILTRLTRLDYILSQRLQKSVNSHVDDAEARQNFSEGIGLLKLLNVILSVVRGNKDASFLMQFYSIVPYVSILRKFSDPYGSGYVTEDQQAHGRLMSDHGLRELRNIDFDSLLTPLLNSLCPHEPLSEKGRTPKLKPQAESIALLPGLLTIGLELREPRQRQKLLTIFDLMLSSGCSAAGVCRGDIEIAWSATHKSLTS